jgi:quercetin dioxygenase-like cupin family protein
MMSLRNSFVALTAAAMIGGFSGTALAQDMGGYEIKSFEDLEFVPFAEGSPLELAVLWGDMATGPVGFIVRVPGGTAEPMHSHTSDYRAIVLEGQALHWIDTEDKDSVEPVGEGGYWFQPADQVHGDANPTDEPTLALIIFDGPVDFVPAE